MLGELTALESTSPGIRRSLLERFFADIPKLIDRISGPGDAPAADVARAAHSLKSNAARFGGERLAALALEFEDAWSNGRGQALAHRAAELRAAYDELTQALRENTEVRKFLR